MGRAEEGRDQGRGREGWKEGGREVGRGREGGSEGGGEGGRDTIAHAYQQILFCMMIYPCLHNTEHKYTPDRVMYQ